LVHKLSGVFAKPLFSFLPSYTPFAQQINDNSQIKDKFDDKPNENK
jgi:hypothetical protein